MTGWHHDNANWKPKQCAYCAGEFIPKSGVHKFCSTPCKSKHRREFGSYTTEAQYRYISGNWSKYFSRLCSRSTRRGTISGEDCLRILAAQNYKCALSGENLTCVLEKGVISQSNASLDRIDPKGTYAPENVQLVCTVLNSFRNDTPLNEFVNWCKKVAQHHEK